MSTPPPASPARTGAPPGPAAARPSGRLVAGGAVLDVAAVLTFAVVGRRSHAEGVTAGGVVETAWPFLVGVAVGWVLGRVWLAPVAVRRAVVVWVAAVAVGLGLRGLDRGAVPVSFAVVTAVSLGLLLLGWRGVARVLPGRR